VAADPATVAAEAPPAAPVPPAAEDPLGAMPRWVWAVGAAVALAIAVFLTSMRG
jgi:hypothetical protein